MTTDRDFKADALRLRHSGSPIHLLDSFYVPMTCCTRLGKVYTLLISMFIEKLADHDTYDDGHLEFAARLLEVCFSVPGNMLPTRILWQHAPYPNPFPGLFFFLPLLFPLPLPSSLTPKGFPPGTARTAAAAISLAHLSTEISADRTCAERVCLR